MSETSLSFFRFRQNKPTDHRLCVAVQTTRSSALLSIYMVQGLLHSQVPDHTCIQLIDQNKLASGNGVNLRAATHLMIYGCFENYLQRSARGLMANGLSRAVRG
jgi:hypothetical protein